jgi:hypothetical protein
MKGDFLVCPACGARNKPKWEFCARCGESLQGVPPGEPEPAEAAVVEDEPVPISALPWLTGLGFLAFGALAVAVWGWSKQGAPAPARPDPAVFTLPTLPPAAAAAPAAPHEPGRTLSTRGRGCS